MKLIKKYVYIFPIIGLIILDQLLKIFIPKDMNVIDGILKFTYVENTGGAFGIFSSSTFTIILFNIIVLVMIARFMVIQQERMTKLSKIGVILVLSGGFSNLIDRIIRGYVVDFIDITQVIKFPIFNFADIMLTIGWICLIIGIILFMKENKEIYVKDNS